jgi:isopenicillin N synthase-like dioxygenase
MPKAAAKIDVITLEDTEECAQRLLEAAKSLGFVYITLKGTGITPRNVSEMFEIVCICPS